MAEAQVPFLVDGMLAAGGVCFVTGAPKLGKSWVVYDLITALCTGGDFLGHSVAMKPDGSPHKVLLIGYEGAAAGVHTRLDALAAGRNVQIDQVLENLDVLWRNGGMLDDPNFIGDLAALASTYSLVVIDPVAKAWTGDENSNTDVNALMRGIEHVTATGTTVLLVHHTSKGADGGRGAGQRMRGASAFHGALDSALHLTRERNGVTQISFESKESMAAPDVSFPLPTEPVGAATPFRLCPTPTDNHAPTKPPLVDLVVAHVKRNPGCTRTSIRTAMSAANTKTQSAVDEAITRGLVMEQCRTVDGRRRNGMYPNAA